MVISKKTEPEVNAAVPPFSEVVVMSIITVGTGLAITEKKRKIKTTYILPMHKKYHEQIN